MGLFGPSRAEIWQQLSGMVGGVYSAGGFFGKDRVDARHGAWTVTLDTFVVSNGKTTIPFTRMRAPFVASHGFQFSISRAGIFSKIGSALGMQDVEIGESGFDEAFVVKSNDTARVTSLLADDHVRNLLSNQPTVELHVRPDEGWFGSSFPDGVDELYFQAAGSITDLSQLQSLFDLFAAVLDRLTEIGSASTADPGVSL